MVSMIVEIIQMSGTVVCIWIGDHTRKLKQNSAIKGPVADMLLYSQPFRMQPHCVCLVLEKIGGNKLIQSNLH